MTTVTPPPDSGTQPTPHYCTSSRNPDGTAQGCPSWPGCLFPGWADDDPEPDDEDEIPELGRTLATLLGWAAAGVLICVVLIMLLPVLL